jgi:hypothetical protein
MEVSALLVDMEDGFVDLSLKMHGPSSDRENGYRFEARSSQEIRQARRVA